MITISIALATCNGGQHVQRQLDSLAAQTLAPAELVISDDRSEDDTILVVERFAKTAPFPVRIYRNDDRLGYRKNFMRASSLCRSDLIAFSDQDDYWYPEKLETMAALFNSSDILLAYHNADVVTETGERIGSLSDRAAGYPILPPLVSGPWLYSLGFTQIFRHSLLQFSDLWPMSVDQNFDDQPLAHDQWFFFLASVFGRIAYSDRPLVGYVQHERNAHGWQKSGFQEFLAKYFHNHSHKYSRGAKAAESRAVILEAAKSRLEGAFAERASAAAGYFRAVASHYAGRGKLYTSSHVVERYKTFHAVLRMGGYAGGPWTLGRRSLVTDLCVGIPFGHLLPTGAD
jgi:glycosyltransferase involved in cell wall biosynthesis